MRKILLVFAITTFIVLAGCESSDQSKYKCDIKACERLTFNAWEMKECKKNPCKFSNPGVNVDIPKPWLGHNRQNSRNVTESGHRQAR